jgi:MFS family permease
MPALLAITASLGAEQPGKFFGILRGSQGISFVVGPMVGSALSFISLRMPFVVDGVLSLCAFLAAIVLLKDTDRVRSGHDLRMLRSLGLIFSDKRVYLYLLMGISGLFGYGILSSFVPAKAQLLGLEAWRIGLILSGGAILFSFVSYVIGTLSDKYGRRAFVVVSQVIIVIAGIGLILSDSFAALAFFYGVFCVGETITFLLCFVYAAELFDQDYIGAFMGAFDSLMDLSLFVGPLLAVSVYKSTDQLAPIFLIAITPAILAFFATVRWLPRDTLSEVYGRQG